MQDVEVYPFNVSKKLYHVLDNTGGNGWVKASCGGEEIFDYWDGKKDDEVYLINNVEQEKIITEIFSFIVEYYYDIFHYNEYDPQGATVQKIIAPNSACSLYETGSGYRKITTLQSDDYYLSSLDYVRDDAERYNFNRYPNGSTLSNQLACLIKEDGHELQDYTTVKQESEKRYIIDNYGNKNERRYVLEQKYLMAK